MFTIEDLLNLFNQLAEVDPAQSPSVRFKAHIRQELMSVHKFSVEHAELIAARMVVELGNDPMPEDAVKSMAVSYAKLIGKMREAYASAGFTNSSLAVVESASQLTVKFG